MRIRTRSLASRSTVLLGCALLVVLTPRPARACTCIALQSPCDSMITATTIFVGTVEAITKASVPSPRGFAVPSVRVRLAVNEAFNGVTEGAVEVVTDANEAACGFPFEIGRRYLVYAFRGASGLSVSLCSRTGPIDARRGELAVLRAEKGGKVSSRLYGHPAELLRRVEWLGHTFRCGAARRVPPTAREPAGPTGRPFARPA